MTVRYKDFAILASPHVLANEPGEKHWACLVYVTSIIEADAVTRLISEERFATSEQAEEHAVFTAKQWIDLRTPLRLTPLLRD